MILLLTACSMNRQFLQPDKIPATIREAKVTDHQTGQTFTVHIGDNFQPTFLDGNNDTADLGCDIQSTVFESASGNRLHAWTISPHTGFNGATLLFLHGNAGNITSQYQGMLPLVQRGFRVFIFDYSGFGFSEGEATRTNALLDAHSALDYLLKQKDTDSTYLIVYGQSFGGHLATKLAADRQDDIDALAIEGAFSSPDDIAAHTSGLGFIARWLTREYFTATESVARFHKPILVIHSTEDRIIPFWMGEKINACANEPKTFMQIDKCHICGPAYYPDRITTELHRLHTACNPEVD